MIRDGSSPLARGLPHAHEEVIIPGRIIPARAGFTRDFMRKPLADPDHPRSRGVYNNPGTDLVPGLGSSPLARGLLRQAPRGD